MHINDGTNQHTYPWIMNRKGDMKDTKIQFNMWVSFLTATKLYEQKLIKKIVQISSSFIFQGSI
jgi:hypothetical protein